MLNPYIKHGTFLVEFDDHIKPYEEINFLKLGKKTIKNKKMIKKRIILLMLKDDVTFKGVVS
jgi:hypothetical protein